MAHSFKNTKSCSASSVLLIFALIMISVVPANAAINFNYTNVTPRNYTITDNVLNSNNFIRLIGGDILLPTINLKFAINKTLFSGNKTLNLNSTSFGPKSTIFPNQKVYYTGSGGTATVNYTVDASSTYFANTQVNVSTFKQTSNNVPFFSDFSIAVLNFNDLKNTWNNDSQVLNEFINTASDENKINDTTVALNSTGGYGPISQNLAPGNYFIWVTRGVGPKEIISWNIIKVMPFNTSVAVGDGSGTAIQGQNLNVNITLNSSAPAENYTYITSIINESDYTDNLGNINITWSSGQTLAQATTVNGTILNNANGLTDIIPRSNTTRNTTNSISSILTLKTGALPAGSYFVHTVVFNSSNLSVAFNQTSLTLVAALSIISWGNNFTNDPRQFILLNSTNTTINFSATANQNVITWSWFKDTVNQNNNFNIFSTNFTNGTHTLLVSATNANGTSNPIIWTINVMPGNFNFTGFNGTFGSNINLTGFNGTFSNFTGVLGNISLAGFNGVFIGSPNLTAFNGTFAGFNGTIGGSANITGNATITGFANITGASIIFGNPFIGGFANITGNATIGGSANITGNATITGFANITGAPIIFGNPFIGGFANITGNATIGGSANITGNATITGFANITGAPIIIGNPFIGGFANITGNATIGGSANITDNATIGGSANITDTFVGGFSNVINTTILNATLVNITVSGTRRTPFIQDVNLTPFSGIKFFDIRNITLIGGNATIIGNASDGGNVLYQSINFTNIYQNVSVNSLIINKSSDTVLPASATRTINTSNLNASFNFSFTLNLTTPALLNVSTTGISPDGVGLGSVSGTQVGNFTYINENISSTNVSSAVIRLYYNTQQSTTVNIYSYNLTLGQWVVETNVTRGSDANGFFVEVTTNHLSTFSLVAAAPTPPPPPTATPTPIVIPTPTVTTTPTPTPTPTPILVSSITPTSRNAVVGTPVTIFMSVVNGGNATATNVSIAQASSLPVTVSYQQWNGTAFTGSLNTPVNIVAGSTANFVLTINATSAFSTSSLTFNVSSNNGATAPISGVNTLTISASTVPSPDIIMISTTTNVSTPVNTPTIFAVATSNVGANATGVSLIVSVPPSITGLTVQVNQTNAATGAIIGPATGLTINSGSQLAFAVFLTPTQFIAFDPTNNRITLQMIDGTGRIIGAQSVVISTTPTPTLVSSITPTSRNAVVGKPVTIFMSVINSGTATATNVSIVQAPPLEPLTVSYQPWNGTAFTGPANTPVNIAAGGTANFVLTLNATSAFSTSSVTFNVSGTNAAAAPISGVNTLTMAATTPSAALADVIMISTNVNVSTAVNTGTAFAVATSNVGVAATGVSFNVVVPASITGLAVQVNQTNPTGAIIGPATGLTIGAGAQPSFAVFLTPTKKIAFDPTNNRLTLQLKDGSGNVIGATSVAVSTT